MIKIGIKINIKLLNGEIKRNNNFYKMIKKKN